MAWSVLNLTVIGLTLTMIGAVFIILGFLIELLRSLRGGSKVKSGGAVLVGPFPIVFGDRGLLKYSLILLILMVILTLTLVLLPGILR